MNLTDALSVLAVDMENLEDAHTSYLASVSPDEKIAAAALVARALIRVADSCAYAQEWLRRENTALPPSCGAL